MPRTLSQQKTRLNVSVVSALAVLLLGLYMLGVKGGHKAFAADYQPLSSYDSAKITKLNVPYFAQQYKNSCEAASLRMALAFYGIKTDDMNIVQQFGYKPRLRDESANTWDDPREMFVGFINGQSGTGYGVYGRPVARVAESFGRKAEYTTDISAAMLAAEIRAGHPIVIWGYTSLTGKPYYWNVPSGGQVRAFRGEHARVIVGVQGSTENPIGFYIHDPITGEQYKFWKTQDLILHMHSVLGVTNQAVIVK